MEEQQTVYSQSAFTRSGKTSILLHYAYKLALKGKRVLFICQKAKIEQVPPLLPPGVDGNDGALSKVHMRYEVQEKIGLQ